MPIHSMTIPIGIGPMSDPALLLSARRCDQCLCTRNRIVTGARAAQIIRDCRAQGIHFICHKGSDADKIIHCRGVHDILGGSRASRFAAAIGIPIIEIDADKLEDMDHA